jgi:hypothetical protein
MTKPVPYCPGALQAANLHEIFKTAHRRTRIIKEGKELKKELKKGRS